MSNTAKIRPLEGFSRVSAGGVVTFSNNVQTCLEGNRSFQKPPIDLSELKTETDTLSVLIAQALDGSRTIIAQKNKQREIVIRMLRMLARYVEVTSGGDMAIFLSSGFQPAPVRTAAVPLSETIRKIRHGDTSGEIVISLRRVAKASSYQLRYVDANAGTAADWTTMLLSLVKPPVTISGLTPATTYVFQTRTLVNDIYTDWSDPVSFMCS